MVSSGVAINGLYESVNGSSTPKDFETLLQLTYLRFEKPRFDSTVFESILNRNRAMLPGMIVAMRSWARPTPGIFLADCTDIRISNVKVHYAQGMGLLAQMCRDITLEGFEVALRGDSDPRYFTTQADATHFSGCKGKIISCNGLYEGMMDDAINVHGTYLKVVNRIDDHTLVGRYMHDQSWGFEWGEPGDSIQFIRSATMDIIGKTNRITGISPTDRQETAGVREFRITFRDPIDPQICEQEGYGIENLTWTPEVEFKGNIIRNNRARGALFSTPQRVIVENNLFDHTSGTAILLCGDCNGWYETGACRNVVIRKNRFVNALTSQFQFTNAIIPIYPEIPDLEGQRQYFHGGKEGSILIEENEFDTFDAPHPLCQIGGRTDIPAQHPQKEQRIQAFPLEPEPLPAGEDKPGKNNGITPRT